MAPFVDWPDPLMGPAPVHCYMSTPSPTGGLFDTLGTEHKPPDLLDIDPELTTTLDLTQLNTYNTENGTMDFAMMENWQMNEVFQDISAFLGDIEDLRSNDEQTTLNNTAMDQMVKEIFNEDGAPSPEQPSVEVESELQSISDTAVDLSWIVRETLGTDVLSDSEGVFGNLTSSPPETLESFANSAEGGLDLLNQLELLPDTDTLGTFCATTNELSPDMYAVPGDDLHVITESSEHAAGSNQSTTEQASASVENDHLYTQLASIKVKPNETKRQAVRRVKNNAASRVCRKQRKNKLTTNLDRVAELMAKNARLLHDISEVEGLVSLLKEHLVSATKARN